MKGAHRPTVCLSSLPIHSSHFSYWLVGKYLLALMTILAQSLLALVSSHLVALLFLSVWHNYLDYFKN